MGVWIDHDRVQLSMLWIKFNTKINKQTSSFLSWHIFCYTWMRCSLVVVLLLLSFPRNKSDDANDTTFFHQVLIFCRYFSITKQNSAVTARRATSVWCILSISICSRRATGPTPTGSFHRRDHHRLVSSFIIAYFDTEKEGRTDGRHT